MTSGYVEKCKDSRWQQKRLKILERDRWKCSECGRMNLELHVHHLSYTGYPWDTPDDELITLCAMCHGYVHMGIDFLKVRQLIRKRVIDMGARALMEGESYR